MYFRMCVIHNVQSVCQRNTKCVYYSKMCELQQNVWYYRAYAKYKTRSDGILYKLVLLAMVSYKR